jgi:protease I
MDPIIIIISQEKFNNFEFNTVRRGLVDAGIDIKIVTVSGGMAKGYLVKTIDGSEPLAINADLSINDIEISRISGIILIGGSGVKVDLWHNPNLHNLLQKAFEDHKLIGAICLAPICLVYAGIPVGGEIAAYKTKETLGIIRDHGLAYDAGQVHVWRTIITANEPKASGEFTKAVIHYLNS